MVKRTIRITGRGIFGVPTEQTPTGELPVGFEFDTEGEVPAGWAGRAVVVGEEPKEGSEFIVNEDDNSEVGKARREIIEKAEAEFKRRDQAHEEVARGFVARAEKAEADLQRANEQIEALNLKLKAFDRDGDGNPGGSNTAEKPSLAGKNKADLIEIAKAEGVELEDSATNDDIRSAIELSREEAAKA